MLLFKSFFCFKRTAAWAVVSFTGGNDACGNLSSSSDKIYSAPPLWYTWIQKLLLFFFLQKHLCTFFVNQNEIKNKLQRKTVFIFTLHYIFLQLSVELAWSKGIYVSKVNRLSLCHGPWVLNTFYLSFLLLLWSQSFGFKFDSLWCNWFVKIFFCCVPFTQFWFMFLFWF